jgi:hypothetical protein
MMTAAERKARERERKKLAGLVRVEVWVPKHLANILRLYAQYITDGGSPWHFGE